MLDYKREYERWLASDALNADEKAELQASPAGVGLMAVTRISLPSGLDSSFLKSSSESFALYLAMPSCTVKG